MCGVFILTEIFSNSETETFLFGTRPFGEFAVTEWRKLEVILTLTIEVPSLLLAEEGLEEVKAMFSSLKCNLFTLFSLDLAIGIKTLHGDDMFNDCRIQTGNHLENNILNLLSSPLLPLPLLLPLRHWLDLLRLLLGLQLFLQTLSRNINILNVNISSILEGIDLPHCSLDLIVKLMRSNTLQDTVIVVSEDNVALGVKLEDEVICKSLRSKGNDDDSLDTHLPYAVYSF